MRKRKATRRYRRNKPSQLGRDLRTHHRRIILGSCHLCGGTVADFGRKGGGTRCTGCGSRSGKVRGSRNNPACSMCGGPLAKLGGLGNLMWYRCQNCGAEQHRKSRKLRWRKPVKKNPSRNVNQHFLIPPQRKGDKRPRNAFGVLKGFGKAYKAYYDKQDKKARKNPRGAMWTYRGVDVFAADRNSSGIWWYARTPGGILRADSKESMKRLIGKKGKRA